MTAWHFVLSVTVNKSTVLQYCRGLAVMATGEPSQGALRGRRQHCRDQGRRLGSSKGRPHFQPDNCEFTNATSSDALASADVLLVPSVQPVYSLC